MSRFASEPPVTLSVIDRLIDEEPKKLQEPSLTRAQSLRLLKASLKRDVEWLLNSRRGPDLEDGKYKEVDRSVLAYGLDDITAFGLSSAKDQNRLRRALEYALSVFEPRITGARVRMEVMPSVERGIRFHIQGLLLVDPSPEPIAFDTVLEMPSGQYDVKGD